jgi:lipopolysaccharide heptosyltransferase II
MNGFEEWGLMIASALTQFILYPVKPKVQIPPRRILVVKPDHIGDLILAIPAVKALRSAFPCSRITALVGEWCLPLVELIPGIDEAIAYRPRIFARGANRSSSGETIKLFAELRRGRFDMAVDLRPTWLSVALAASKGFRWRVDRSSHRIRMKLRGESSVWDHEVKRNLAPLREADIPLEADLRPALVVPQRVREKARELLSSFSIGEDELIVAFHPGSPVGLKRWNPSNFAELGDMFVRELGARVLIVGSRAETEISEAVMRRMKTEPVDLTGRTDLLTLAGVLERCDLFVGNDSGPMHIAAALGVKTIGLFGPSSPERFGPYGDHCLAIRPKIDCPPCMSHRCRLRPGGCMDEINVEEILLSALKLLRHQLAGDPHLTSASSGSFPMK